MKKVNKLEKIIKENNLDDGQIRKLCNNEIYIWSNYFATFVKAGLISAAILAGSATFYLNNKSDSARNIAAISGLAMAGSYVGLKRTFKVLSDTNSTLKANYNGNENYVGGEYNANRPKS